MIEGVQVKQGDYIPKRNFDKDLQKSERKWKNNGHEQKLSHDSEKRTDDRDRYTVPRQDKKKQESASKG